MHQDSRVLIFLVVISLFSRGDICEAAFDIQKIALSGEQAPGLDPGVTFSISSTFTSTTINGDGAVAFHTNLSGVGESIWKFDDSGLTLIAKYGDLVQGSLTGTTYGGFFNPLIDANSQVTFVASTSTGPAIVAERGGIPTLIADSEMQVPGTGAGTKFQSRVNFSHIAVAGDGELAFNGSLLQGVGDAGTNNSRGIWVESGGQLSLLVRGDDPAPGFDPGVVFSGSGLDFTSSDQIAINRAGQMAFRANVNLSPNQAALWTDIPGSLKLLGREGGVIPGYPTQVFGEFGNPSINSAGKVVFVNAAGHFISGDLWSYQDGSYNPIVLEGMAAASSTGSEQFHTALLPQVNDNGDVAFYGTLLPSEAISNANDRGIWVERNGGIDLIAQEGMQAPGRPSGSRFTEFDALHISSKGRVAFLSSLSDLSNNTRDRVDESLWAENIAGELELVLAIGDEFEVGPDDIRIVTVINFSGSSAGSDRVTPWQDNADTIAIALDFSDGSSGIFTATLAVPEPSSSTLVFLTALGFISTTRVKNCCSLIAVCRQSQRCVHLPH